MKGFLLDTNVLSELAKGARGDRCALNWLDRRDEDELFVSVLTIGEICKGMERLTDERRRTGILKFVRTVEQRFAARILNVDRPTARRWGILSSQSAFVGRTVQAVDGLIAATALENDLSLATRNVRDFRDLNLTVVDPFTALA